MGLSAEAKNSSARLGVIFAPPTKIGPVSSGTGLKLALKPPHPLALRSKGPRRSLFAQGVPNSIEAKSTPTRKLGREFAPQVLGALFQGQN